MLLVLVEGHDAEVVRGGELDDVGEGDADVLLGDEGAEGLAQLLEDLRVALEQRDAWEMQGRYMGDLGGSRGDLGEI